MDLTQLANLGEFIGGVAVLVTLLYLAVQIRQNTKVVAANTQNSLYESWASFSSQVIQDPGVAGLLVAAKDPDSSFSPEEAVRLEWLSIRLFGQWENAYAQLLEGVFDPKHWVAYDALYRESLRSHHFQAHWDAHRDWYFEEFVSYVDGVHADGRVEAARGRS